MFLVTVQTLLIRNKCKPLGLPLFNHYPRAKRVISYVCSNGSHSLAQTEPPPHTKNIKIEDTVDTAFREQLCGLGSEQQHYSREKSTWPCACGWHRVSQSSATCHSTCMGGGCV